MRYLNNNRFPGSHVPIWRRRIRTRVVAGKGKWPEAKQRIEIRREKIEGRVDIPVSFSHARVRHTDLRTKRARLDRFRDYAKIICMTMKYDRLFSWSPEKMHASSEKPMGNRAFWTETRVTSLVNRSLQIQFPLLTRQNLWTFSS